MSLRSAAGSGRVESASANYASFTAVGTVMQITLHHRTFAVKDAPFSVSLLPFATSQRHTFTHEGTVYEAVCKEVQIVVPDDAKIDPVRNLLSWTGDKGVVKSTAREVFELVRTRVSGFRMAK
jgi:hypothetical protein